MSWFKSKSDKPLDTKIKANSIVKDTNGLYVVRYLDNLDGSSFVSATLHMDKDNNFVWRKWYSDPLEGDQKYFDSIETAVKSAYLEAAQRAIEKINKHTVAASEVNV